MLYVFLFEIYYLNEKINRKTSIIFSLNRRSKKIPFLFYYLSLAFQKKQLTNIYYSSSILESTNYYLVILDSFTKRFLLFPNILKVIRNRRINYSCLQEYFSSRPDVRKTYHFHVIFHWKKRFHSQGAKVISNCFPLFKDCFVCF